MAAARAGLGSRDGVTRSVSSNVGPSGIAGLSKMATGMFAVGDQAVDAELRP
jgi:hypothetical protein